MRSTFIMTLLMVIALSGCAAREPRLVYLTNEYRYADTKPMLEKGPNTIKGSALWRQQGGGIVTCAGNMVALVPKTSYSTERFVALYGNDISGISLIKSNIQFSPESLEYKQHILTAQCDAQGYFTFENVADGNFFVTSSIVWTAGAHNPQGGALMKSISVKGGEVKTVVLAP